MYANTSTADPGRLDGRASTQPGTWRRFTEAACLGTALGVLIVVMVTLVWRVLGHKNDFPKEAWPAYRALDRGQLLAFVRLGPAYFGSLIIRAPFALIASAFGAGWRGTYVATAVPCVAAAPLLGAWLSLRPRERMGAGLLSRVSPIVLCCLNPIFVMAIVLGHPEEVLGASLCIAAVILATDGRGDLCGVLLGLALIDKSWTVVAVPVAFAVLPHGRRRAFAIMLACAAAVLVPAVVARQTAAGAQSAAASLGGGTGTIFLFPQLLYWFGSHAWVVREAHLLIPVVAGAVASSWWLVTRRRVIRPGLDDVLALLALVFILRAALDPWDNAYYHVPFLLALMSYEARRPPLLTIVYSVLLIVVVPPVGVLNIPPSWHAATYALVAVPTIAWLAARAFGGPHWLRPLGIRRRRPVGDDTSQARGECARPAEPAPTASAR